MQVLFRYKRLLEQHLTDLAELVSEENGKTRNEAIAEIEKCIELTEFATSLPQLTGGEVLEVSKGVECRLEFVPLGVVASIVPFNFPAMVPNWTIPNAIALGNCMIIKPSEKVPLSCGRLALLLREAGLPDGAYSISSTGMRYHRRSDLRPSGDRRGLLRRFHQSGKDRLSARYPAAKTLPRSRRSQSPTWSCPTPSNPK